MSADTLSAVSGLSREELHEIATRVKQNLKLLDACDHHDFQPIPNSNPLRLRFQCSNCTGEIDAHAYRWYVAGQGAKLTTEAIARVCHEVNRAYCEALGDTSQPLWENAPDWQKNSAMLGVQLHVSNPDAGVEASHASWMRQKVEEGWVYGPVKDPEAKQHPCMVPFSELPREQQAKDFIFRAVVHALAHS